MSVASPYLTQDIGTRMQHYLPQFGDYYFNFPIKGCFVDSKADILSGTGLKPGFDYQDYKSHQVYHTGYFYYQLSCNGMNSFCDPHNLWIGDNNINELVPAIAVTGSPVTFSSTECVGYSN
jgi:hypothetical protein